MGTQNKRHGSFGDIESFRYSYQQMIDSKKNVADRRMLGQFSTPYSLAQEITKFGLSLIDNNKIKFLEPAIGTGVFYSALNELVNHENIEISASGFEIDKDYYNASKDIWDDYNIDLFNEDFLSIEKPLAKYNLVLTNPPYVRHHLIQKELKPILKKRVKNELGINISGLAGLYCYFMLLADKWLEEGAVCGWLLPSEFMDVNYGSVIKDYLINKVHLLRIHRYNPEDCQFDDAIVSSCVVWFKKESTTDDYDITFSYGGTHNNPANIRKLKKSQAEQIKKWTHVTDEISKKSPSDNIKDAVIGDFFDIKRGLATGDNGFFIMNRKQIIDNHLEMKFFKPILPSPRKMKLDEVMADDDGNPEIDEQLFLLDCNLSEDEIEKFYPSLWEYLCSGLETTATKYLCKNRKKWYFQERREPTAFLCSYMGRGNAERMPFRFILNHSNAIASNSYLLLYPKENLQKFLSEKQAYREVWDALQNISISDMESEGRVYGGGLKKIEPKELAKVKCNNLRSVLK